MSDLVHGESRRPAGVVTMSPAEKLACEWEARHDVAARGRRVDPAAALQHYLSHLRWEEELSDHGHRAHSSKSVAGGLAAEGPMLSAAADHRQRWPSHLTSIAGRDFNVTAGGGAEATVLIWI